MTYKELQDDGTVFNGVKHQDVLNSFIHVDGKTYTVRGFTTCPHCGGHIAPSYVYLTFRCLTCHSVWTQEQYLELLIFERDLTRELDDIEHSSNLD